MHNIFYAVRGLWINDKKTNILMHREIMNAEKGQMIDHIDGSGINNTKKNLRFCTYLQNARNRKPGKDSASKYIGVCWHKKNKRWVASIHPNRESKYLGCYKSEKEAAGVYNKAALKYYGEFARLNVIQ